MKNLLLLFSVLGLFVSCNEECEVPSNGFIEGTELNVQMGQQNGVDIFKEIDAAWAEFDFEKVKNYVHDDALMKFADGRVATGGEEFVQSIKDWAEEDAALGNEQTWTTDYAFALAVSNDNDDSTNIDQGDWVNAQFTSELKNPKGDVIREVFYEFYHIVDGKIASWSQFKRDEKKLE